jgi:two-component system, NarL family, nitrate/nitrite response regulator NarL
MIRVVLADDHPLVLDALEQLFRIEGDIAVVARCTTGREVAPAVRIHRPDVLILDVVMAGGDGLSVLRELHGTPDALPTILLTALLSEAQLLEAIRLGVRGVLLKDMAPRLIVQCVRKVHAGGEWLEQKVAARAMRTLLRRASGEREAAQKLTPRELELVRHVATGLRNKEIAERLSITEGTVKIHLHNVYEKVGVEGRVALAVWAKDRGLV